MKHDLDLVGPLRVRSALEDILRDQFQGDDYTLRLWNAEAKLEELGFKRGRDGRWRKKVTAAELKEMQAIRALGEQGGPRP